MRTIKLFAAALVIASVALSPIAFAGKNAQAGANRPTTPATALAPLTEDEISTLLWMREEEKVARDVYIAMNEKWNAKISGFHASEQKHCDAIAELARYGIEDPTPTEIGEFSVAELQAMYDTLMVQGNVSYLEALKVGVAIDPKRRISKTSRPPSRKPTRCHSRSPTCTC